MSASTSSAARHLVRRTLQARVAATPPAPARPLLRRRPRPFSTTTVVNTPPPPAPPGGAIADAPLEAAKEGSWAFRLKVAGFILGPLSLPTAFVAALVYDHEFRDDVDARFPEVVDYVRQHVGFEEDLTRRRTDLEKAFISEQPLGVTVQLQSGQRLSQQVSPLQTLSGLYDSLKPGEGDEAIVSLDFEDISEEKIEDPTLKKKELPSSGTLGVVPPSIRSMTLPSLWDKLQDEEGGMGGGMVGDSIRMKRQRGNKGEDEALIDELEASLRDVNEEIGQLKLSLRQGSARAIDDIEADIAYLQARSREIRRQLRGLGKWWRYWW